MMNKLKGKFCRNAKNQSEAKSRLFSLTPTLLEDGELAKYSEDFETVFDNTKILNIALSGPYGSGKSTVIESWENREKPKGWLYVSFTNFEEENDGESRNESLESIACRIVM